MNNRKSFSNPSNLPGCCQKQFHSTFILWRSSLKSQDILVLLVFTMTRRVSWDQKFSPGVPGKCFHKFLHIHMVIALLIHALSHHSSSSSSSSLWYLFLVDFVFGYSPTINNDNYSCIDSLWSVHCGQTRSSLYFLTSLSERQIFVRSIPPTPPSGGVLWFV